MLKFLICSIFSLIGFTLYCCVRCSSMYDKEQEDLEQEEFLRNWK